MDWPTPPQPTTTALSPDRTCAVELDLSVIGAAAAALPPAQAPTISAYPVATQDVALVVRDTVPAVLVQAALAAGASSAAGDGGGLLEDVRLFYIYTGEQVGEGNKSLAYRLRFRAPEYEISEGHTTVATVSKRWFRVADTYGVEMELGRDPVLVLAATVAVDSMAHEGR